VDGIGPMVDARTLASSSSESLLARAQGVARGGDAVEAAAQFERLFASLLVKEMRRGLGDGFFGSGAGADVYEGWLDEHLGQALSEGRGLGLRVALERELGAASPQPAAGDASAPSQEELP